MYALPPSTNPLQPPATRGWFPPLKFRRKAYAEFCRSFDQALAELEAKHPSHRSAAIEERRSLQRRHRPK